MATEDQLREYLKRAVVDLTESRRRVTELEDAQHEPIAVIGMSCRFPGGADTVEDYWQLLREGRSGVVEVPASRWNTDDYYDPDRSAVGSIYTREGALLSDITGWDAEFFGFAPNEALRMDPNQRLLMELVWEGFENAGIAPARLAGSSTAVLVGLMDTLQYGRLQSERYGPAVHSDPYFGPGVTPSVLAGRLAYQFDLRGPAVTIDTACSSSLVATHLGVQSLRRGECDLAVAAGVFLIVQPDTYVQACATSQLTPGGRCKTFDAAADGYVMGEGGGLVVLERLSSALANGRRIRAVLRGSAVNQDGRSNGLTAPSRSAQVDVIRRALCDAKVAPEQIGYVEAHGSATNLGDAIELSALHDVFGARSAARPLRVGAVKTNIGHTQSAAGVAGLIKTVLLLENGLVPGNLNFAEPTSSLPADGTIAPVVAPVPFPDDGGGRIAGVSGFGWSGTNAHVVLEAAPDAARMEAPDDWQAVHALPLSAASDAALRDQLRQLAGWLDRRTDCSLTDIAHTLASGRAEHDFRRAVVCTDRADAVRQLGGAAAGGAAARVRSGPRVAFLLPGVGDQYPGLGHELYRAEPVFARAIDECIDLVERRCGVDLRPLFYVGESARTSGEFAALFDRDTAVDDTDPMNQAENAHPLLFTVEYALATLLLSRGVRPDALVGYSLGEYVAACLAGVFTLSDALYLVVERARLIAGAAPGRMLAAAADEDAVRAAIIASGADVDIAALNGPSMTVVSGVAAGVETLARQLQQDGIACKRMRTAHAFHSSLLAPVRDKLAAVVDSVERRAPRMTILSNRTGEPLTAQEATSKDYWADHLINPVRFAQSVQHCLVEGIEAFVELGAGQTLGGLVRRDLAGGAAISVLGTLPPRASADEPQDESTHLLSTFGRLWELGVPVDWTAAAGGRIVDLPTYPFQRRRFWPEPAAQVSVPITVATPADPNELCYATTWRRDVTVQPSASVSLPGPLVIFTDDDGVGGALAELAAAAGTSVVEVAAGTEFARAGRRITIDPAEPEHYRRMFSALAGDGPLQVVHLWSLLTPDPVDGHATDKQLHAAIGHGYASLLLAVQAAGEHVTRGVRLLTVSRGAVEVLGADVPAPHRALPHGFGRAVRHEYPGLSWHGVDLDPDTVVAAVAAGQLAHELSEPRDPAVAGWRRGRRWVPDWAEVSTDAGGDPAAPVWRADGVYLITGGIRGLGQALARRLVAAGVRKLALVSRSASRHDPSEFTQAGVEVLLLDADTGVPDQLRAALRRCREHFGALDGVVHAAGVPASGMAQRQSVAGAGAVLAPKVLAMGPLAELVGPATPEHERPELVVLYSSAITAFGAIGESDYCAANTVLDSYGQALAAAAPSTRVVSVAWGPWQHDDWQSTGAVSELGARAGAYRERYGFPDEVGCALLERIVRTGLGSVVAVRQPMSEAAREWAQLLDLGALVEASVAPTGKRFPRPALRSEYVAPRTRLETVVAGVWEHYLGIDHVGVQDPFFDLGGNSLVGMAMVHALERKLETQIAPAVLFEHPTVAEFAAALERTEAGTGGERELLDASAGRGQRRRNARPSARKGNSS